MAACVYCSNRKGKRNCPALGAEICPLCCGKHRLAAITCPSDCRWLHGLSLVQDRASAFTREQYFSACNRLLAFVDSPANADERDAALTLFKQELVPGAQIDEGMLPVIRGYLAYGDRDRNEERAIDRFVKRFGHGLSSGERAALAALQESWASIFEVEAVAIGSGLTLRDRIRDERIEVRDVSSSGQLVRGEALFSWIMRVEDHLEMTGASMLLPEQHVEPLLDSLRHELEACRREYEGELPRSIVGELASFVVADLAELMAVGAPKLVTTHGEEVVFCEAHYEVRDVERLRAKLASQPTLEAQGKDDYVWIDRRPNKQLGGGPTVLGSIRHDDRSLVMETSSRERLERGRALLQRIAGKAIVHKLDALTDPEAKAREPRTARAAADIPPELQAELIGAHLREHYLNRWVKESIPALGGQTPRAAARSKEGRARVAKMIDEAERFSKDIPGGDDPALWNDLRASLKIAPREHLDVAYDAGRGPAAVEWLAADDDARLAAVRASHERVAGHPETPNPKLHALMHVIVENQLTTGDPPEVPATLARLMAEGLSRHEAVHAVASIVADEIQAITTHDRAYDREGAARRLQKLRADDWHW